MRPLTPREIWKLPKYEDPIGMVVLTVNEDELKHMIRDPILWGEALGQDHVVTASTSAQL
jgi:hypothetical protein